MQPVAFSLARICSRHVHGIGKTGFYQPTALLVILYINLVVIILNRPFYKKASIFNYFFIGILKLYLGIKNHPYRS